MTGGKFSRDKGARTERALVRYLQEAGFAAERIPLSGAMGGKFKGDISVPVLTHDWTIEVKCRADGFKQIYDYLDGANAAIIKADRRYPIVCLSLDLALSILKIAERNR